MHPTVFEIPPYVGNAPSTKIQSLPEEAFFDRFKRVVEESGFVYRPLDLQRFHLSVKCGEMTVLGGPSGTGKSSLPALLCPGVTRRRANERTHRMPDGEYQPFVDGHPRPTGPYEHAGGQVLPRRVRAVPAPGVRTGGIPRQGNCHGTAPCVSRRDEPLAGGTLFQRFHDGAGP